MTNYNTIWFQINQAWKCNMNCSYCHVKQDSSRMTTKIIDQIIKQGTMLTSKYNPQKFYFVFLGGEPLLNLPIIFELSEKTNIIPNVYKSLWTNGLILNDDIMKELVDKNIDVVLSANESSDKFILEKSEIIKRNQEKSRVSITVNEMNRQRLPELTESLLKENHLVRYYMHYTAFKDPDFINNYINTMKRCIDIINKYINHAKELNHMFEFLELTNKSKKSPYLVGRSIFVFDPDGTVRTALPLKEAGVLGNVSDNKDYIEECKTYPNRRKYLPRWSSKDIEKCQNCEVVKICQGGYPVSKYYDSRRFDVPSPYCRAYKELIPEYIKLYNEKENHSGNKKS